MTPSCFIWDDATEQMCANISRVMKKKSSPAGLLVYHKSTGKLTHDDTHTHTHTHTHSNDQHPLGITQHTTHKASFADTLTGWKLIKECAPPRAVYTLRCTDGGAVGRCGLCVTYKVRKWSVIYFRAEIKPLNRLQDDRQEKGERSRLVESEIFSVSCLYC